MSHVPFSVLFLALNKTVKKENGRRIFGCNISKPFNFNIVVFSHSHEHDYDYLDDEMDQKEKLKFFSYFFFLLWKT